MSGLRPIFGEKNAEFSPNPAAFSSGSIDFLYYIVVQVFTLEKVLGAEPDMAARVSTVPNKVYLTAEFLHITET